MNVADLLTRQASATPHATAIVQGDRALEYAACEALVWGLCRHLRDCGLRPDDVVGLHLSDPLVHLLAVLSLARSGMISVAITVEGADTEGGTSLLVRTGAAAVIHGARAPDWGLARQIPLDLDRIAALAADADDSVRSDRPDRLLHYKTSSGTTGAPKIVGATHAGMIASIERETACIGYPAGERYLTPVSLRYDGPRRRYLACLASGGTAVMPPADLGPASLLETIDRHDIRHYSCVPSQAHELAAAVEPGRQRFPQMRCLRLSAGPSDASLHRLLRERLTANVLISYGCTELGPITVAPPDLVASRPQTVGRPMPGVELQVVSAEDHLLPPDAVGLIRIRAEGMPQAYHDDPEATAKHFRDGWFYPGDLGKVNEEGLLFHMGRADGMMIMNGINIYPAEIEQAMLSHPAVRDAVAFPLKHRVVNDVPVCAVVLNDDQQVSERDLLAFARARLGSHGPRRVAILDAMPRSEHGKVQRQALAAAVAARLGVGGPDRPLRARRGSVTDPGAAARPAVSTMVSFRLPTHPDLERLDAWLNGVLHLDVTARPAAQGSPLPGTERLARAWLRRALLLSRMLLQTARIPVSEAPRVMALRPDPGDADLWQARVAFDRVDALSDTACDIALKGALYLNAWAMAHPVDTLHRQVFNDLVRQRILSRLQSMPRSRRGDEAAR